MSLPPLYQTGIFNSSFFSNSTNALTLAIADKRYLNLGGGSISGSLSIGTTLSTNGISDSGGISSTGVISAGSITITPSSQSFGTTLSSNGIIWRSTQDRYFGCRQIDTNNISLLSCSAGGTYNDVIVWGHTATPTLTITGDINVTGNYKQNGSTLSFSLISGITTIGTMQASKAVTSDANNVLKIPATGSSTANCLNFAGGIQVYNDGTNMNFYCAGLAPFIFTNAYFNFANRLIEFRAGSTSHASLYIDAQANSGAKYFDFYTSNCPLNMGINSQASVGNFYCASSSQCCISTMTPQSGYPLTIGGHTYVGGNLKATGYIQVGTATDTTRMISCLDSTLASGSARYITLGQQNNPGLQAEISFQLTATNSLIRLCLGFHSNEVMFVTNNGRVGIGTNNPRCSLDIATSNTVTLGAGGTATIWGYNVMSNGWGSYGLGPYSAPMSLYCAGNIVVQTLVYTTSDRRLKKDIMPLDVTEEQYMRFKPVSYRWKNSKNDKVNFGLIAQDLLGVASELLCPHPNENLTVEGEGDLEGIQWTVDHQSLHAMHISVIKKLIAKVDILVELITQMKTESEKQAKRIKELELKTAKS